MTAINELTVKAIDGSSVPLSKYAGKVKLIVNVASECGFTPQYSDLEKLWEKYKDKDFVLLGFPSNDFGAQEPGTEAEIATFCKKNYGVTFPLFAKVPVLGPSRSPLYEELAKAGGDPKWNFHKYLVDKKGGIKAYKSKVAPMSDELTGAIDAALAG